MGEKLKSLGKVCFVHLSSGKKERSGFTILCTSWETGVTTALPEQWPQVHRLSPLKAKIQFVPRSFRWRGDTLNILPSCAPAVSCRMAKAQCSRPSQVPSHHQDLHTSCEAQQQFSQYCGRLKGGSLFCSVLYGLCCTWTYNIEHFPPKYQAI